MALLSLPSPNASLLADYQALTQELDQYIEEISLRFKATLRCGPGCSECCMAFSLLPLEAAILQQKTAQGVITVDAKAVNITHCSLLRNSLCQVYEQRPIICRTQGLPIAYVDPNDVSLIEVSACPLNFPIDFSFNHDDLLFMDHFNARLVKLNLHYCRLHNLSPEKRIPISAL